MRSPCIPHRIERIDIVKFINHLAEQKASAITRQRKLAAIRGFLKFCKDNQIIYGNPADTIEGPIREERDPAILLKTEYKALLRVAGGTVKVRGLDHGTGHFPTGLPLPSPWWTQRRWWEINGCQNRGKHRPRFLTEKSLRCGCAVCTCEEKVVNRRQTCTLSRAI
jgi:hypothetical protein